MENNIRLEKVLNKIENEKAMTEYIEQAIKIIKKIEKEKEKNG